MEEQLEEMCKRLRDDLKKIEMQARSILKHSDRSAENTFENQRGEQKAQAMLAVRHIEDARMRLGKVIQYNGTGVSCYDK